LAFRIFFALHTFLSPSIATLNLAKELKGKLHLNGRVSQTKTLYLFILPLVVNDLTKCDHFGVESWGLTKAERTSGGPNAATGATRAERPGAGATVEPLTDSRRALQEFCDVCRLLPSVPDKKR
jgi:hypothetical protein